MAKFLNCKVWRCSYQGHQEQFGVTYQIRLSSFRVFIRDPQPDNYHVRFNLQLLGIIK